MSRHAAMHTTFRILFGAQLALFLALRIGDSIAQGVTPPSPSRVSPDDAGATALAEMDRMVVKFESFFSNRPKLLQKYSSKLVKSGATFLLREYSTRGISFDVQKSDSLVSPFIGFIQVNSIANTEYPACGSLAVEGFGFIGFATIEEAIASNEKPECFPRTTRSDYLEPIRFNYSYQRGKWILKSVTLLRTAGPERPLTAAILGIPTESSRVIDEPAGIEFNRPWRLLALPQGG